ncbi:MAG: tetratricopeptide repeat protein [Alphaproteobacteria bacterium]|nr:tetratricopeptide repeat protein [Alphaproteobacteria bacterium]
MRTSVLFAAVLLLAGCGLQKPIFSDNDLGLGDNATVRNLGSASNSFSSYLSARFAASDHDLTGAARFYSQTLKSDPADSSLLGLSFIYAATSGDFAAAGTYAASIVTTTPDDRYARLTLAVIAFKKKDYTEARRQLSLSAKGPLASLTLSLFDVWAAAAQNDKPAMEKDLAALAAEKGAENIAAFHMGLLSEYSGNFDAAETAYKQALKAGATPRVLEAYGRMLERAGRAADATALYTAHKGEGGFAAVVEPGLARIAAASKPAALVTTPSDGVAEGLFGFAASLSDNASADVSVLYLRMALYLRPDFALSQILLADRFDQLQRYEDAIAVYRTVDIGSPFRHMATMGLALDLTRSGHTDAAIVELKRQAAADSKDNEAWIALGDAYRATDKNAEALEAYDRAVAAIGIPRARDWPLFFARAMVKEKLKDAKGSEAEINTALKLSPNEAQLLNYLGYAWVDRGERVEEALTMLEKARSLRPYDGYIVDSVGWAYYKLGRYDDAAKTLEQAVLLVPGDPTINEHLGDALWRAGKPIDARFQWNHALTFGAEAEAKAAIEQKLKAGLPG